MEGGSMQHSSVKRGLLRICLFRAELLWKDTGKLSKQTIKIDVIANFDIAPKSLGNQIKPITELWVPSLVVHKRQEVNEGLCQGQG